MEGRREERRGKEKGAKEREREGWMEGGKE